MNIMTIRGMIGIKQTIVSMYTIIYDKTSRKVTVSRVFFIVIRLKMRLYALTRGSTLETKE